MKITKNWLKNKNACESGSNWFVENHESIEGIELVKKLIDIDINWANWLITKMLNKKQCIEYAIFAAEKVLYLFENKYPNDYRARKAIHAAKIVYQENTSKNRAAANAANAAAYAASYAFVAGRAANDDAAANAAAAAANAAAYAAAYAADDAAAKNKLRKEIILNGIEIYKGGK